MALTRDVYGLLQTFPAEERFALCDQVRRSAVSVVSNVAEGFGRESTRDFIHFLSMSRGSLFELSTQLELAEMLGYCTMSSELKEKLERVGMMLNALSSKLKSRLSNANHEPRAANHEGPKLSNANHEPRATNHE